MFPTSGKPARNLSKYEQGKATLAELKRSLETEEEKRQRKETADQIAKLDYLKRQIEALSKTD